VAVRFLIAGVRLLFGALPRRIGSAPEPPRRIHFANRMSRIDIVDCEAADRSRRASGLRWRFVRRSCDAIIGGSAAQGLVASADATAMDTSAARAAAAGAGSQP